MCQRLRVKSGTQHRVCAEGSNRTRHPSWIQGPDRPIPTRVELKTPKGVDRQFAERLVRYFTKKRVRMDDPDFRIGTLDQGNPDQQRRDKLPNFYAALQRELLHHENWDGTPRT